MFPFSINAPGLTPSFHCSPSVCADIHATAKSRLEEGDVDGLVRGRFGEWRSSTQAATGSRLLRQMAEARDLTSEKDPLAAMTSLMREGASFGPLLASGVPT